jgi:glucose-6-phosphate isomerase
MWPNRVYLGLGSNLNHPANQVIQAMQDLAAAPDIELIRYSSLYQTEPVGPKAQPYFINAVVEIATRLTPLALLAYLKKMERQQGRQLSYRWGPRQIDLDILLYEQLIYTDLSLILPHPQLLHRSFVMLPLFEIAPQLQFPDGSTLKAHLTQRRWKPLMCYLDKESLTMTNSPSTTATTNPNQQAWQALQNLHAPMAQRSLMDLFAEDPHRIENFSLSCCGLYLDYSKNFLDKSVLLSLEALAITSGLPHAIEQLFTGVAVNVTEARPALHTALRQDSDYYCEVDGQSIMPEIIAQREKMAHLVKQLHSGAWVGASGQAITDVVNLGIGGSDLGPKLVVEALAPYHVPQVRVHFVSNLDPHHFHEITQGLNPATTLFIVSSKSFTTSETLHNAQLAKQWLAQHFMDQALTQHFIAITTQPARATALGIAPEHILTFWEWVGGRYSVWSSIGLPVALAVGMEHYLDFLEGAKQLDQHFRAAPFSANMPVLMALIGVWYTNFFHCATQAILPYDYRLRSFPDYLQQLDMESNGKAVQNNGQPVSYKTGPLVFGQMGTNGQHAFYQLLHQGTHLVPIDFIAALQSTAIANGPAHDLLLANCFAQSQALMLGKSVAEPQQQHMPGNRPSNTLLLETMSPYTMGALLALYEHKIFVQGIIWNINSFDQPGVELGKTLAEQIVAALSGKSEVANFDPSTQALIESVQQAKAPRE